MRYAWGAVGAAILASASLASAILPSAAQAAPPPPVSGLYVSGQAGIDIPRELDLAGGSMSVTTGGVTSNQVSGDTVVRFDPSAVGGVGVGWGFGNGLRVELQGWMHQDRVNEIKVTSGLTNGLVDAGNQGGRRKSYGLMVAGYYDVPYVVPGTGLQPYFGFGLGWNHQENSSINTWGYYAYTAPSSQMYQVPVKVTVNNVDPLAGQFELGLQMPVAAVPGLAASLSYRLVVTAQGNTRVTQTPYDAPAGSGFTTNTQARQTTTLDQMVLLGLRYQIGGL